MGQGGSVNTDREPKTLADRHAELLGRLATGGDRALLARVCAALGAARDEGDVCVDLSAWCRAAPGDGEPARPALERARDALLQYGGFPTSYDTWELVETSAARWSAYGSGCPSSSGVAPTLDAQPGSAPVLGQPLVLELGDLPATPLVFVAAGLSGSQSGGVPLPIDLSSLGMPGCAQFVGDLGLLQAAPAIHAFGLVCMYCVFIRIYSHAIWCVY